MSVWPQTLRGSGGELLSFSISVDPLYLEDLLESLARSTHPINPRIAHEPLTIVEFPGFSEWVPEIESLLKSAAIQTARLRVANMLEEITAACSAGPPGRGSTGLRAAQA